MVARKHNSTQVNAAMVRRRFAELDKGKFTILDELFDSAYVLHFPGISRPLNLATTKRFYEMLYAAFPDLRHTLEEQISARNKVVTRWTARGTHRFDWMGIAATGKRVSFSGINIYTVRRGRLAESQVNWDILGLAQQLGATSLRLQFGGKRIGAAS
jgi:predicted ester cyclase